MNLKSAFIRAINKTKLNVFKEKENLVLAINSAKSIGCQVINITAPLIQVMPIPYSCLCSLLYLIISGGKKNANSWFVMVSH